MRPSPHGFRRQSEFHIYPQVKTCVADEDCASQQCPASQHALCKPNEASEVADKFCLCFFDFR